MLRIQNFKRASITCSILSASQIFAGVNNHSKVKTEILSTTAEKEIYSSLKTQSEAERFKIKLNSIFECPQDIKNPKEESSTKFWYLNRLMNEEAQALQALKKTDPENYPEKAIAYKNAITQAFESIRHNNSELSIDEIKALGRIQLLIEKSNEGINTVMLSDNAPTDLPFKKLIGMIPAENNPWIRSKAEDNLDWGDFENLSNNKVYQSLYQKLGSRCFAALKDQKKNPKAFASYIKDREKPGVLLSEKEKEELGSQISKVGRLADYIGAKENKTKQDLFNQATQNLKYPNFFHDEAKELEKVKKDFPNLYTSINEFYQKRSGDKDGDVLEAYAKQSENSRIEIRELAIVANANFKLNSSDPNQLKLDQLLPNTSNEEIARLIADVGENKDLISPDYSLDFIKQIYVLRQNKPKNSSELVAYLKKMGTPDFINAHPDSEESRMLLAYYQQEYSQSNVSKAVKDRLAILGLLNKSAPKAMLVTTPDKLPAPPTAGGE